MENANAEATEKKVLVLSDNETLAQVIEFSLRNGLKTIQVRSLVMSVPQERQDHDADNAPDLIVVAMSSPSNEPVVALARASLGSYIGRVPILIISDKCFQADLAVQIAHLDFPFVIGMLNDKVNDILYHDILAGSGIVSEVEARMA
ncbi:MAG TPA: hypothetical protein PKH77_01325 [Anaerolineae bacterium]|nr:hypothetical protein [Anaerolineae bacterium]